MQPLHVLEEQDGGGDMWGRCSSSSGTGAAADLAAMHATSTGSMIAAATAATAAAAATGVDNGSDRQLQVLYKLLSHRQQGAGHAPALHWLQRSCPSSPPQLLSRLLRDLLLPLPRLVLPVQGQPQHKPRTGQQVTKGVCLAQPCARLLALPPMAQRNIMSLLQEAAAEGRGWCGQRQLADFVGRVAEACDAQGVRDDVSTALLRLMALELVDAALPGNAIPDDVIARLSVPLKPPPWAMQLCQGLEARRKLAQPPETPSHQSRGGNAKATHPLLRVLGDGAPAGGRAGEVAARTRAVEEMDVDGVRCAGDAAAAAAADSSEVEAAVKVIREYLVASQAQAEPLPLGPTAESALQALLACMEDREDGGSGGGMLPAHAATAGGQGADGSAGAYGGDAAGFGAAPDHVTQYLCRQYITPGMSYSRCCALLSLVLLPKAMALTAAPSAELSAAVVELAQRHGGALVQAVLRPCLGTLVLQRHHCELLQRAARALSPPRLLADLVLSAATGTATASPAASALAAPPHLTSSSASAASAVAPPPEAAAAGAKWTEETAVLLQQVLAAMSSSSPRGGAPGVVVQQPLGPAAAAALAAAMEAAAAGPLGKSAKFMKLLLSAVSGKGTAAELAPHRARLAAAARSCSGFMAAAVLRKVDALPFP